MSDVYLWETYDKLGREALDRGDLEQANEAFRSAIATAEELQTHDRLVLSLRNLAATMQDLNQMADAHELLIRTLEVAQQQLGNEHSQTVETLRDLSQLSQQLGYLDKADALLKLVLEQDIKSQSADRIGSTLLALARLAQAKNEPAIAAAYLQRVVKLNRQKHGDNHPEVAQSLLWLATALYQCGKTEEARSFMKTAFGLMEKHFADEPIHLAQSLLAGAKLMVDAGQLDPALVHQKRALDLLSSELEPENERLWEAREYIATTLAAMGKLEEAVEILEFCFRHGNPQGARAGATYKNLAGLYLALDKKEKAEELYLKGSEVLEATLGIEHPAYLATQEERIQLYHFTGRSKEALEVALKTIRATEKRFGTGHPNTAQAYASTALLAHGAQEWQTALELMRAAEKIWSSLDPRPEDVLANCHANIATCLIKMNRHAEAEPSLVIAESWGSRNLKPVLAELRAEMESGDKEREPIPEEEPIEVESADDLFGGAEDGEKAEELFSQEQLEEDELSTEVPSLSEDFEEPVSIELFSEEKRPEVVPLQELESDTPEPVSLDEMTVPPAEAQDLELPADSEESRSDEVEADELFSEDQSEPDETSQSIGEADDRDDENETASDELFGEDEAEPETGEPDQLLVEETSAPWDETEHTQEDENIEALDADDEVFSYDLFSDPNEDQVEDLATDEEEEVVADDLFDDQQEDDDPQGAFSDEDNSSEEDDSSEEETGVPEINDPDSPNFVERRAAKRSPLSFNRFFRIQVASESGSEENHKSFLVDLGEGGIRINSETPFPLEYDLTITLPEEVLGETAEIECQVVWQKALYGASFIQGLAFRNLTDNQKNLIEAKLNPENGVPRSASRQHFRLYRPFPIKLQAEGHDEWVTSYATDLSVNGIGTRLKAPLEQGNPIRLRLELEFELPTVEVEARVAWSKSGENGVCHGLQFASVGPVEARTIKRYIDRCLEFLPD